MAGNMELRHLRFFVAVAEAGSLTLAAERRLHTAQPSLSRQMRDLECEVGTPLMLRSSRGIELTPAGIAFLDHARLALTQADAAITAARRAAETSKASFALGFLTGQEMEWLPQAMRLLQSELPSINVTITSDTSPELADALLRERLDLAFMRREPNAKGLTYVTVAEEPLVVVLPSDHRLAGHSAIDPHALVGETFINVSGTAPALRTVVDDYLSSAGLGLIAAHEVDNLAMAVSLVASTRGVALLPDYARNFLPWSVTSRPLSGIVPTIDLVVGYNQANRSTILAQFVAHLGEIIPATRSPTPSHLRPGRP
jgi:LysR family hca operon transcriptional activator